MNVITIFEASNNFHQSCNYLISNKRKGFEQNDKEKKTSSELKLFSKGKIQLRKFNLPFYKVRKFNRGGLSRSNQKAPIMLLLTKKDQQFEFK